MRFPNSFLSKTETIYIRDLVDLLDFFPLVQIPPSKMTKDGLTALEAVPAFSVSSISETVTTLICENEDFGYQMGPNYFDEYFEIRIPLVVQQFPNLQHLHLPALHAFYLMDEGKSEHFQRMYEQAVLALRGHEDNRVRRLQIHLDQQVL